MQTLLNYKVVTSIHKDADFAESHGSDHMWYLGGGLLYYTIPYMIKARLCVCIGSGGGFVPRLMIQAVHDIEPTGTVYLIDANIGPNGRPNYLSPDAYMRRTFPDIKILNMLSSEACAQFEPGTIDYLHIDGDHTYKGCRTDFEMYRPKVRPGGYITIHDSSTPMFEIHKYVEELKADPDLEILSFPAVGMGVTLVRCGTT